LLSASGIESGRGRGRGGEGEGEGEREEKGEEGQERPTMRQSKT